MPMWSRVSFVCTFDEMPVRRVKAALYMILAFDVRSEWESNSKKRWGDNENNQQREIGNENYSRLLVRICANCIDYTLQSGLLSITTGKLGLSERVGRIDREKLFFIYGTLLNCVSRTCLSFNRKNRVRIPDASVVRSRCSGNRSITAITKDGLLIGDCNRLTSSDRFPKNETPHRNVLYLTSKPIWVLMTKQPWDTFCARASEILKQSLYPPLFEHRIIKFITASS